MEKNLWDALHCTATKTELAALALYGQSVSHPYMKAIRESSGETNMLDLGPFHKDVQKHIKKIMLHPYFLVGPHASFEKGSLDRKAWHSPRVFEAIQEMASTLPHLEQIICRFFEGASKAWKRFTSEFSPGGLIDESTTEEKERAWMPATNDVNEGSLGSFRVLMRSQPQLSLLQYNAQAMFHNNNTQAFMDTKLTDEDHTWLHKEAREMKGVDKKRRLEIIEHNEAKINEKQEASKQRKKKAANKAAAIAKVELIFDKEEIEKLKGEKLKDHLRAFKAAGAPGLEKVSTNTKVAEIRKGLLNAVELFKQHKWKPDNSKNADDSGSEDGEEVIDLGEAEGSDWNDD